MDVENSQRKLLDQIRSLAFAVNDLALYLDTHPCDTNALKCHNDYAEKLEGLKRIYQREYGPLTIYSIQNDWDWIETPWPWERGGV